VTPGKAMSAAVWVTAAEIVATDFAAQFEEEVARREGYGSALERRWAIEAALERRDNGQELLF